MKMHHDGIPVDKVVTQAQDGPNVQETIFKKVNETDITGLPKFPGLIDFDSCTSHTVHNAFGNWHWKVWQWYWSALLESVFTMEA